MHSHLAPHIYLLLELVLIELKGLAGLLGATRRHIDDSEGSQVGSIEVLSAAGHQLAVAVRVVHRLLALAVCLHH